MRALAIIPFLLLVGCSITSKDDPPPDAPSDTTAPVVGSPSITGPARFTGGTVSIRLPASDDHGVTTATAIVTNPDGSITTIALTDGGDGAFIGSFAARANVRQDGLAEHYAISMTASDTSGNQSSASGTVDVPAPMLPPGTPEFSP